ncbi:tyrosine-type recombinase/integrase [Streptomyces sp. GDS52]|uniref:tyrosine-type recombinase/integrase n=1 Tax=Streptomyces sp. GDS52 TaxID=3406419 RepID=UPI003FD4F985
MSVEVKDEEWLYSEEQVRSLLDWVRGQAGAHRSVYPFMRMVAEQALRPSEARALRVSDVMLLERDLGKLAARHNGMVREIPLQPQVTVFLREWISESDLHDADLLFPGTRGGPLSVPYISRCGSRPKRPSCQGTRCTRGAWGIPSPSSVIPAWRNG